MADTVKAEELDIVSTIGFEGNAPNGMHVHPGGRHLIYPLGSTVVVKEIGVGKGQTFLQGHTDRVSCLTVSKSGRYIASGQVTHMGFQADIIVWDFERRELIHRLTLHKVKVEALAFSPNDIYLASLGGVDDNSIVIWELATGRAVCGSPAARDSAGSATCVAFMKDRDETLVSAGHYNLRIWDINHVDRKLRATDITMKLKRIVNCLVVDQDSVFCGCNSGDVIRINLKTHLFAGNGPVKTLFNKGILSIAVNQTSGDIVVGAGDGTLAVLKRDTLRVIRQTKLKGGITSISMYDHEYMFAGTNQSNTYYISFVDLKSELRHTCHNDRINDVCFAEGYSELFATCSVGDIRVWNARTRQEMLRIVVPNLECNCICFMKDGKAIVSGWSDGKIRAFYPQSGRLMYVINDAHVKGVTAISCTNDCTRLISGGNEGQVRVWRVTKEKQIMEASMKEHKGSVTQIQIRANDRECVSSSADGSTIIWDLSRFVRNKCLFASTFFKDVVYHPDESQILTTGTDRKLTYWDTYDGSAIREIEGCASGVINALAIATNGNRFISAGSDHLLKIWNYDEGMCTHIGVGHSGNIIRVKISPDQSYIVSVSDEGAIFVWAMP